MVGKSNQVSRSHLTLKTLPRWSNRVREAIQEKNHLCWCWRLHKILGCSGHQHRRIRWTIQFLHQTWKINILWRSIQETSLHKLDLNLGRLLDRSGRTWSPLEVWAINWQKIAYSDLQFRKIQWFCSFTSQQLRRHGRLWWLCEVARLRKQKGVLQQKIRNRRRSYLYRLVAIFKEKQW